MTEKQQPALEPEGAVALLTAKLLDHLQRALASRDVIGQAKGVLMERLKISADEAFEELRAMSQRINRNVSILATELAMTRANGRRLSRLPSRTHGIGANLSFARTQDRHGAAASPERPGPGSD